MNVILDIKSPLVDIFTACNAGQYAVESDNIVFAKPTNLPWLSTKFICNDTTVGSLGDDGLNDTDGIFQIDLNWPPNTGEYDQGIFMEKLYDFFTIGLRIEANNVETEVMTYKASPGRKIDNQWRMSVTIGWRAWAKRKT